MAEEPIISHIRKTETDWEIQTNEEHQTGVAKLAEKFADAFGMGEWGRILGLLHDKGKEKRAFQQHIKKGSGYDESARVEGDYNHAYVGALIAKQLFPKYSTLIENALMGHHRGLYDDDERRQILRGRDIPNDVTVEPITARLTLPRLDNPRDIHHLVRMLYSSLVDADYLDTEAFMQPKQSGSRSNGASMKELLDKLESYLDNLRYNAQPTDVNHIRNYVQKICREKSDGKVGAYSLTVPTGGGKTLASVLWALRHAVSNNLKKIIIAIPYTSIITQTAATLRSIFGEENVLEHHSNINWDDVHDKETRLRLKLATENWDYPIVVSTNVQLFESLFSNRPSDCRKLHNIAKSVLILDEAQMLPREFLQPVVDTLETLTTVFTTSILLTTASQPILTGRIEGASYSVGFEGLGNVQELIPPKAKLYDKLRRVQLEVDDAPKSYDEVASEVSSHEQVLCVVNTRRDAKELYVRLAEAGDCYHLSRMMCPAHIRETISEIKEKLKSNSGASPLRVVSTQLIEAGVDIDFPIVYRQQAGLDSVLQAAGRCNREGLNEMGKTYVFSLQKEHPLPPGFISNTNDARMALGNEVDWLAPETMTSYFRQLYSRTSDFDKPKVKERLYSRDMYFESVAKDFHMIDDNSTLVIINWKDSMDIVEDLKHSGPSYALLKRISQFSVNVRERDLKQLQDAGVVDEVCGMLVVRDKAFYDDHVGLITENHWLEETLIM